MDGKVLYEAYLKHPMITTDTRNCPEGSIFIALKGASFDGNEFVLQALEKGCSMAITSRKDLADDPRCIVVDDTLQAFKDLAREHRRQFRGPVIGITGTNGKTTTKELVATVLQKKYRVMFTQGNFNNDVGVPKTLMQLTPEHDIAVVEMGANHPGDIKTLVETVEPDCGLITNIGRAHLLGFGSFEGVKKTKGELYDNLVARHKPAFLNQNDADLSEMAAERGVETLAYAKGTVVSCAPYVTASIESADGGAEMTIHTQLIGSYNLPNILAAVTVGRHFGIADSDIAAALEAYTPSNNRSQLTVTSRNHLVVDAYNANPTSMAAALENFRLMDVPQKMMILGSMGELGEVSHDEHMKVIDAIAKTGVTDVWLVGKEFADCSHSYRQFKDVEEVKEAIKQEDIRDRYILIKGSNSQKLFQLPEEL